VHRLGQRDDVAELLAAGDLIVQCSAFGEGFPNALAEGMACGLPAVATDVGDARRIVGDSGLIVPAKDPKALAQAIRTLLKESLVERLDRRLRARARVLEEFPLARLVAGHEALYAALLQAPQATEPCAASPAL
jgi:glycosyltransferase involved in cell wall biosynthesis